MVTQHPSWSQPTRDAARWLLAQASGPRRRTLLEYAEQEIVIPTGAFAGRPFRCERQPYSRLWLEAAGSGRWRRCFAVGPTQAGKSLVGFVIPILYHLFEHGETVLCAVPHLDMAGDKWREDLLPVIERTRYRDWLPRRGGGSRGGSRVEAVTFANGATLRFMTAGGGDKSRAGFTARVVVVTEVDGFDVVAAASREADKFRQVEARSRAYGARRITYGECTVSIESGRIWQEFQDGTGSEPALCCPHCGQYARAGREHLRGWQDAATVREAGELARWYCPRCSAAWSEGDRRQANLAAVLLHRGQQVVEGQIAGEPPDVPTFSFRWNAVHNLFTSAAEVGQEEWRATRAIDDANAERALRQFVWALPAQPPTWEATPLEAHLLAQRVGTWPRGLVPAEAVHLTVGVDVGQRWLHWLALAWLPAGLHVVDYGRAAVHSAELGAEPAIVRALEELRDAQAGGWTWENSSGPRHPDQTWVDCRHKPAAVAAFCRQPASWLRWLPTRGQGTVQHQRTRYTAPRKKGGQIKHVGEGYHLVAEQGQFFLVLDADHWKSFLHQRLAVPQGQPGALTLYRTLPREHERLARHFTAERQIEEFVQGLGLVRRWEVIRGENHWLDAAALACAAGHLCGWRLIEERPAAARPQAAARRRPTAAVLADRPFLVSQR